MQLLLTGWNVVGNWKPLPWWFHVHTTCNHSTCYGMEWSMEQSGDTTARLCWNPHSEGTQWCCAADKPHNTCQPGERGGEVLLPRQQLWWNHSPQMNLVHYNLIVILAHTYIPQVPPPRHTHPSVCLCSVLLTVSIRAKWVTPISSNPGMHEWSDSSST